jgi:hypothetical protein
MAREPISAKFKPLILGEVHTAGKLEWSNVIICNLYPRKVNAVTIQSRIGVDRGKPTFFEESEFIPNFGCSAKVLARGESVTWCHDGFLRQRYFESRHQGLLRWRAARRDSFAAKFEPTPGRLHGHTAMHIAHPCV